MSILRCFPGWGHSIGCYEDIYTKINIHGLGRIQYLSHQIWIEISCFIKKIDKNQAYSSCALDSITVLCFDIYAPSAIMFAIFVGNSVVSKLPWIFSQGCLDILVGETVHLVTHKGAYQYSAMCMIYAPKICSLPLRYAPSVEYIHSRNENVFTYVWVWEG